MKTEQQRFERLQRLVAMASDAGSPHEAQIAAARIHDLLDATPLPVRYIIPVGAEVRLVPSNVARTAAAKTALKAAVARKINVFYERHRVKGIDGQNSLAKGHLVFERHGYIVFVPVGMVRLAL